MFLICLFLTYGFFSSVIEYLEPNVSTTLFYLGLFLLATLLITVKQRRFPLKALVPGLLCVVTSLSFLLHNDKDLLDVLLVLLIPLSGIYCLTLTESNVHSFGSFYVLLDLIHCELTIPLRHLLTPFLAPFRAIGERRKDREHPRKNKTLMPIVIGVLVAIPILLIVIPLLLDADAAFESFAGSAYRVIQSALKRIGEIISQYFEFDFLTLFLTLLNTPFIYAVIYSFSHGIAKQENHDTSARYRKLQIAPLSFLATVLGIVSAVYVFYLFSQSAYFFSAFSGHLPSGISITVTEYARRGFFEMVKIAGVNFVLIAASVALSRRRENRIPKAIKGLDIFLCAFTMLLCVISIFKILMYIRQYGLTEKRLYVFTADIALIVCFAAILLRFVKERFPYMKVMLGAVFVCSAVLGLIGVNNTIAWYNTNGLLDGKLVSYSVRELSDECGEAALPYLQKIAASDSKFAKQAKKELKDNYYREYAYYESASFANLEQARVTQYIREEKKKAESFFVNVNLDTNAPGSTAPAYALGYAVTIKGKVVYSGGLTNADGSPLEQEQQITISRGDLPKKAKLSKLDLKLTLTFAPENKAKETKVKNSHKPLLQNVAYGEVYDVSIIETNKGYEATP